MRRTVCTLLAVGFFSPNPASQMGKDLWLGGEGGGPVNQLGKEKQDTRMEEEEEEEEAPGAAASEIGSTERWGEKRGAKSEERRGRIIGRWGGGFLRLDLFSQGSEAARFLRRLRLDLCFA